MQAAPPAITVRADHPFAFAILHTATNTPLFIGHVAEPPGAGKSTVAAAIRGHGCPVLLCRPGSSIRS